MLRLLHREDKIIKKDTHTLSRETTHTEGEVKTKRDICAGWELEVTTITTTEKREHERKYARWVHRTSVCRQ